LDDNTEINTSVAARTTFLNLNLLGDRKLSEVDAL